MSLKRALDAIEAVVGRPFVLRDPSVLATYGSDAYTLAHALPAAVVVPGTREELARVMALLAEAGLPVVARGAGTSLSGGAIPLEHAVVVHCSRLNRILAVDYAAGIVECEPGVVNRTISDTVAPEGFFYPPDPSSQQASTVGGNAAENAGGPHCLKYGVTAHYVLMAEAILADGQTVRVGHRSGQPVPLDWLGTLIGSEGTLAVFSRLWVRIRRLPRAARTAMALFDRVDDASEAVTAIIGAGIVPSALEMMDQLAIEAVERGQYRVGYPLDIEAVLLVEVDGDPDEVDAEMEAVLALLAEKRPRAVRTPASPAERDRWWANRKTAFGAMGLIAPSYYVQDGVIPRSRLPEILRAIRGIGDRYGIRIANVFHAGDGNLHPLLLYDSRNPDEVLRVEAAGSEVLKICVQAGGSITGEHGIGIEKRQEMAFQFSAAELEAAQALKRAFDPRGLFNPGKIFPAS